MGLTGEKYRTGEGVLEAKTVAKRLGAPPQSKEVSTFGWTRKALH
jgi:hypothetical protein